MDCRASDKTASICLVKLLSKMVNLCIPPWMNDNSMYQHLLNILAGSVEGTVSVCGEWPKQYFDVQVPSLVSSFFTKKKYSTGQQPLYNHLFSGQFQRILVLNPTVWGWLVCDPSPWPRRQPYSSETRLATDMAWPHSNWGAPHMARGSKNKVEWIRWIDGFFWLFLTFFFSNVQQFRKYLPASEVPKWYVTSIRPAAQPLGEAGYSLWRL